MSEDIPHLRQIDKATVDALCDRAQAAADYNYTVRLEVEGFRESRTPWDATRLANALATTRLPISTFDGVVALVRDLDAAAYACAGCVPGNRMKRRA